MLLFRDVLVTNGSYTRVSLSPTEGPAFRAVRMTWRISKHAAFQQWASPPPSSSKGLPPRPSLSVSTRRWCSFLIPSRTAPTTSSGSSPTTTWRRSWRCWSKANLLIIPTRSVPRRGPRNGVWGTTAPVPRSRLRRQIIVVRSRARGSGADSPPSAGEPEGNQRCAENSDRARLGNLACRRHICEIRRKRHICKIRRQPQIRKNRGVES